MLSQTGSRRRFPKNSMSTKTWKDANENPKKNSSFHGKTHGQTENFGDSVFDGKHVCQNDL